MGDRISDNAAVRSISASYLCVIEAFAAFLVALSDRNCRAVCLEQVSLIKLSEEYGRVKVWGDQTRADLPERARGSLDDTLRHDAQLKKLVQDIIWRLEGLLKQATNIAQKKYDSSCGSDQDSVSSVSADSESDPDSNAGSEAEAERHRRSVPKIFRLSQQITDQVRSLFDLSALLRRPKIVNKYLRSEPSKTKDFGTDGSNPASPSTSFITFDESHVTEKTQQWRGLTKSSYGMPFEEEEVSLSRPPTRNRVEHIPWFTQRLAQANTRRREQLEYWNHRPYDSQQATEKAAGLKEPTLARPNKGDDAKSEARSQASTLKPPGASIRREGPKSSMSKQSFSTVAVSDVHETKTNLRPRTEYAPTLVGQGRTQSIPGLPKAADGNVKFSCPYCGMMLETSEMKNKDSQAWKRHVFHDLRPYVCTFEDCSNAAKMYVSRHDWMYHELQLHRRRYVCQVCHVEFPERNKMSLHFEEHYGDSIPPTGLNAMLDLCNRQADVSDTTQDPCLLCGEALQLSVLQEHLAAHMEDIALFVLPGSGDDDESGGSNASVQVAGAEPVAEQDDTNSKASSLGFDRTSEETSQTPTDFAKLLDSRDAGFQSKISMWNVVEGVQEATQQDESLLQSRMSDLENQDADDHQSLQWITVGSEDGDQGMGLWKHSSGHQYSILDLIKNGMDLEVVGAEGETPLTCSVVHGNEVDVSLLLRKGVHLETTNSKGQTPLTVAIRSGRKAITVRLLVAGADANAKSKDDGLTPVYWASQNGYNTIVQVLLAAGADANAKNDDGSAPLHRASRNGYDAVVQVLLAAGADANAKNDDGSAPLHWASQNGHDAVVQRLLAAGADANAKNNDGSAPLHWASQNGHDAVVQVLLAAGADANAKKDDGSAPLHWASWNGYDAVVQRLLAAGADANAKNNNASAPLHWASGNGHDAVVQALLAAGADASAKNNNGSTPLHAASENGHDAAMKRLLDASADADKKDTVPT